MPRCFPTPRVERNERRAEGGKGGSHQGRGHEQEKEDRHESKDHQSALAPDGVIDLGVELGQGVHGQRNGKCREGDAEFQCRIELESLMEPAEDDVVELGADTHSRHEAADHGAGGEGCTAQGE